MSEWSGAGIYFLGIIHGALLVWASIDLFDSRTLRKGRKHD